MLSFKTISIASISVLASLISQSEAGTFKSCPSNSPESCSSSSVSNTCCTASPGGSLLQTQFWDTDPVTGPDDSWTIHGLWPDSCSGSYVENCDSKRAYKNITQILQAAGQSSLVNYMSEYWQSNSESNEAFWEHEWSTHGTCVSTLAPSCYSSYTPTQEVPPYFEQVVNLFKSLPTYDWLADAGIYPDDSQTYALSDMQNAISSQFGEQVYFGCSNGQVYQIYYYFTVQGPVQSGTFYAAPPTATSNCPSQVSYLPKNS